MLKAKTILLFCQTKHKVLFITFANNVFYFNFKPSFFSFNNVYKNRL
jgi:hypothetical protein